MKRPVPLENAPMHYAPLNELGVVFLFFDYCKKNRIRIEKIGASFPDCTAYHKSAHGTEKRVRIEFEYKASSFKNHKHDKRKCDWIVCWENDWPGAPKNLRIIELRMVYGYHRQIWIRPALSTRDKDMIGDKKLCWRAPGNRSHVGDLHLMYKCSPEKCITHVYLQSSPATRSKNGVTTCYLKKICDLKSPVFWEDFKNHKILSSSPFVRGHMQGNPNATEYWMYIFNLIVNRNRSVEKLLHKYI